MNNINLSELMKGTDGLTVDGLCTNDEMNNDPAALKLGEDKEEICDLDQLTQTIIEFLQYVNEDNMVELEINDHVAYVRHLEEKFDDFSLNYYNIFKMLTIKEDRDANVVKLLGLIELLSEVKSGKKDINKEFERFREEQAETYIYPEFGSKAKFEEAVVKRAKKKQRKKAKRGL